MILLDKNESTNDINEKLNAESNTPRQNSIQMTNLIHTRLQSCNRKSFQGDNTLLNIMSELKRIGKYRI